MTVKEFIDVLITKVSVSIVANETDREILNFKNDVGVSDNLATAISGATIKRIQITGSQSITVVLESL